MLYFLGILEIHDDTIIDADYYKQPSDNPVQPPLQGLHPSVEQPDAAGSECQNPGDDQYRQRRGYGEEDRQQVSGLGRGRHRDEHPEVEDAARRAEGQRKEHPEQQGSPAAPAGQLLAVAAESERREPPPERSARLILYLYFVKQRTLLAKKRAVSDGPRVVPIRSRTPFCRRAVPRTRQRAGRQSPNSPG